MLKEDQQKKPIELVEWEEESIYSVFVDHKWIEPNENIEEEYLFVIKRTNCFLKLQLRLVSKKIEWNEVKVFYNIQ